MPTQAKLDTVKNLKEKLGRAKALVLADYSGLSHKQLEDLRKLLKKVEAEFTISKNSLLKRALTEAKKTVNETHLKGATATLLAYADEVDPIKALVKFFKDATKGIVKGGLLGSSELGSQDVERLATLPPRNVLYAQLVGHLQAPVYGLHNALSWNMKKLVWVLEEVRSKKQ